ncbi:general substrate transporter [Aaosphaeria arxii CBS 175.79]|uniref:General substrate transporter n=1 Tax=Aaosphaeria arxii CBS 175.79 TaxID=1450172 RepID=A0A6A5Y3X1_9PLEO|nr:general substrate transporter [Aaosphaeria arxii CBS 175.79]KAF2019571.1 general substrate transporter [Aaosphaeria arxii CBS 175.79]
MHSWLGRGKSLRAGVTVCCLIAFVLFGYDQGVFGGILQNKDWLDQFDHPSDSKTGIIVSCYNLGCLAGCVLNFCVGEILGRRRTIWTAMGFVVVGAILQTTAYSVPHLVIGRVITGVGTGLKTSTVPMYQAELCDRESRGKLVSAEVLFVGVGIVLAYWFDFGMSYVGGAIAWRLPIAFQIVFALVVIVLVFALPESPRWLFNHGKDAQATAILCAVYDMDPMDEYIVNERHAILQAIELERSTAKSKTFFSILQADSVRTRYRVLLAWGIQFMNQAGGINLVVYYIPSVLIQNVGMTPHLAQILGGCINMMLMFGTITPSIALDRMGRRKTMIGGCLGLGICMLMISALLSQSEKPNGHTYASAAVAFFFLYMFIFGMTVHCVPWVYVPEVLPLEARTKGTAIGISSNWLWNFTVVMITPVIINRLQWKAYLIFMATNLLFVPLLYFFYPETSNLGLEDIDKIFSQGGNPVHVAAEMVKELKLQKEESQLVSKIEGGPDPELQVVHEIKV